MICLNKKIIALASILISVGLLYFLADRVYRTYAGNISAVEDIIPEMAQPAASAAAPEKIPVPNFTLQDLDGNDVSLSDYEGRAVVLNFWASWCPPCKAEFPEFHELNQEFADRDDVALLTINLTDGKQETREKCAAFLKDNGYEDIKTLLDEERELAYLFGINGIPATFIIDAQSNLVTYTSGQTNKAMVYKMLEKALAQ